MADRNSEKYKPGPDSTKKIVTAAERVVRSPGSFLLPGSESRYINPFLIAVGAFAQGIVKGGPAKDVRNRGRALDHLIGVSKDKVGTQWTVFDHDPSSFDIIFDGLEVGGEQNAKIFGRWVSGDSRLFINNFAKGMRGVSAEGSWYKQSEIFPQSALDNFFGEESEASVWTKWKRDGVERFRLVDFSTPRSPAAAEDFHIYLADEPSIPGWGQRPTMEDLGDRVKKGFNLDGVSIDRQEARERMLDPDRLEIWDQIIVGAISQESKFRSQLAKALFITPTPESIQTLDSVKNSQNPDELGDAALLSLANVWRNRMLSGFVLPTDITVDIQKRFLEAMDPSEVQHFFNICPQLVDEQVRRVKDGGEVGLTALEDEMVSYFRASRGGDINLLGGRHEVAYIATVEKFNPTLRSKITSLGYGEKYNGLLSAFEQGYPDWSTASAAAISTFIEESNLRGFANFGDSKKDQIEEVSDKIWQRILKGGVHFVQSGDQISTVLFDGGSLATRAGLVAMHFRKSALVEGRTNIMVQHNDFDIPTVAGYIDSEGKLVLRSGLEQKEPGYHAILRNVAVASLHDLVRQEPAINEVPVREKEQKEDADTNIKPTRRKTEGRERITRLVRRKRRYNSIIQEDTDVQIAEFTTRHIDGHRTLLKHAGEIDAWVKEYLKVVTTAPISERQTITDAYREVIEEADAVAYKISPDKENNVPFGMKLDAQIIPFPNSEGVLPIRRLKTWTAPHISPAVTDEERASLSTSFERRFTGDGSQWLEWAEHMFLEQIK